MSDGRRGLRVIGSATARIVLRGWGCPECVGPYGRGHGDRCISCNPPRNPPTRPADDDQ